MENNEMEKQAQEQMQKVALAVRDVVVRNVYLPVFAKTAAAYGIPAPQTEEELSKLLNMADYLVTQKQAAYAQQGSPIDAMFGHMAKQAGVQYNPQPSVPDFGSIINDADVMELSKQAAALINQ